MNFVLVWSSFPEEFSPCQAVTGLTSSGTELDSSFPEEVRPSQTVPDEILEIIIYHPNRIVGLHLLVV